MQVEVFAVHVPGTAVGAGGGGGGVGTGAGAGGLGVGAGALPPPPQADKTKANKPTKTRRFLIGLSLQGNKDKGNPRNLVAGYGLIMTR